MIIALLLINGLFYLLLMLWYRQGLQLLEAAPATSGSETGISVVVCARNEAENLPALLQALQTQRLAGFEYEVLLVDDNSEDDTAALMAAAAEQDQRVSYLASLPGTRGKKAAITRGIEQAFYPVTALCDADSVPQEDWLQTLYDAFTPEVGVLLGVTRLQAAENLFSRIVQIEYAGILGIGLAATALGVPLFGSGSNLAVRKSCFREVQGYQGIEHIPSGDDTLLIQRVSRRSRWQIRAMMGCRGQVVSRAPQNFSELLSQRARWSSTQFRLPDLRLTLLGLNTFLLVSSTLIALLLGFFKPMWGLVALLLLLLKMLSETGFLLQSTRLQGIKVSWRSIVVGQFWELIYIPLSPLLGLTGLFRWRRL